MRVLGVRVVVSWTWLLFLLLLTWLLADAVFPRQQPGLSDTSYVVMAVAGSLLFFGSVLAHELCHALASRREGVAVRQIRLFLFGGASEATETMPRPAAEFRVVAAGPAATACVTALFLLGWRIGSSTGLPVQVTGVFQYLWQLNLLLLAFNLVPVLPLDGGRLVHAWIWERNGDQARATLSLGRAGHAFSVGLLVFGILTASTGFVSGVWLILVGGFLMAAVRPELDAARAMVAFGDLTVAEVMTTDLVTLRPDMTVAELADVLRRLPSHPLYPVEEHGRLAGALVLSTAGRVPLERRPTVRVEDVMLTGEAVPTMRGDLSIREAARTLARAPGRAAVLDDDRLVGVISSSDLARIADRRGRCPSGTSRA